MSQIQLDPASDVPVYRQIIDQVRLEISAGHLHPGDHLEPIRRLATRLGVNSSTVARAYGQLERDGVIHTNRRSGSVVAVHPDVAAANLVRQGRLRGMVERALLEALAQGYDPAEVAAAFDLQLAAWNARRHPRPRAPPSQAPGDPFAGAGATTTAPSGPEHLYRFAGSHDLALELLWAQARRSDPALTITASYVGSLDGLLALLHRQVGLAGAHILDEESGEYNLPILRRLFPATPLCVVTLAERRQGLIVPAGNPQRLSSFAGLGRPGLRFVNRQPGSGTRTLLDSGLRRARVDPEGIAGYHWIVPTHLDVAAAVADGRADAGLGLQAAARAYGLGFVPLANERYDIVVLAEDREREPVARLLDMIAGGPFRASLTDLSGYDTARTGQEIYLNPPL